MHLPFFNDPFQPTGEIISIEDGQLTLFADFLPQTEADIFLDILQRETPWQQDALNFGGRQVLIPRLQAWYGDKHSHYGYSGLALTPLPWTDTLLTLKQRIEVSSGQVFNSVLLNFYRDGKDSVSWHSDDEAELGLDPVIASLSLGTSRRFELRHRTKTIPKAICELEHGSLLIMGKGLQKHWQHQIPKQPAIQAPRINLTFRLIQPLQA